MAVGDVFSVVVQQQIDQRVILNTFAYEQTVGSDDPAIAFRLAEAFDIAIINAWKDTVTLFLSFQCIIVRRVTPTPSIPFTLNFAPATVGTDAGESLPAFNAMVIKYITDNVNPRHNGRKYIAGVSEGQLVDGMFQAMYLGSLVATFRATLEATLIGVSPSDAEWEPRVINRVAAGVPIVPPTVSNLVSTTASPIVFRQKRRLTGLTAVEVSVP